MHPLLRILGIAAALGVMAGCYTFWRDYNGLSYQAQPSYYR
jgi:hypothetical protein